MLAAGICSCSLASSQLYSRPCSTLDKFLRQVYDSLARTSCQLPRLATQSSRPVLVGIRSNFSTQMLNIVPRNIFINVLSISATDFYWPESRGSSPPMRAACQACKLAGKGGEGAVCTDCTLHLTLWLNIISFLLPSERRQQLGFK